MVTVALVEFDVVQAHINCNIHPDKIHRQLSSSGLATGNTGDRKQCHLSYSANVRSFKFNFHYKRCHHSYKTTTCTTRPLVTVVMLGYAEKSETYLLAIINQRLIISGDVELNPGPLGGELIIIILLYNLGVSCCIQIVCIYNCVSIKGVGTFFITSRVPIHNKEFGRPMMKVMTK